MDISSIHPQDLINFVDQYLSQSAARPMSMPTGMFGESIIPPPAARPVSMPAGMFGAAQAVPQATQSAATAIDDGLIQRLMQANAQAATVAQAPATPPPIPEEGLLAKLLGSRVGQVASKAAVPTAIGADVVSRLLPVWMDFIQRTRAGQGGMPAGAEALGTGVGKELRNVATGNEHAMLAGPLNPLGVMANAVNAFKGAQGIGSALGNIPYEDTLNALLRGISGKSTPYVAPAQLQQAAAPSPTSAQPTQNPTVSDSGNNNVAEYVKRMSGPSQNQDGLMQKLFQSNSAIEGMDATPQERKSLRARAAEHALKAGFGDTNLLGAWVESGTAAFEKLAEMKSRETVAGVSAGAKDNPMMEILKLAGRDYMSDVNQSKAGNRQLFQSIMMKGPSAAEQAGLGDATRRGGMFFLKKTIDPIKLKSAIENMSPAPTVAEFLDTFSNMVQGMQDTGTSKNSTVSKVKQLGTTR